MGFNKKYIPSLEDLMKIREGMNDDDRFLDTYLYKPDALIGSSESLDYLKQLSEKKKEKDGIKY